MPELPDIQLYLHALGPRVVGRRLERVKLFTPFVLRSVEPTIAAVNGRKVVALRRLGKRIVFELEVERGAGDGDAVGEKLFLVVHLMIAGRFQWKEAAPAGGASVPGGKSPSRIALASFQLEHGTLLLTEAGTKKRASLHVVLGEAALRELDPGGLEPLECTLEQFRAALVRENHTVKRTLTDPHTFSGIGNAYSDEILWRARLSPFKWTTKLSSEEVARLFEATRSTLREWIERLRKQTGETFPSKVTAFRPEMAVHGKFGKPCPKCAAPVQRIVHAENESNYCARCQTEGKVLADRALSQLLKEDWPRTIEEWEAIRAPRK
jgi:formamidopyrimidine-DNA glycosylase